MDDDDPRADSAQGDDGAPDKLSAEEALGETQAAYRAYRDDVQTYFLKRNHTPEDADELTQDTFLKFRRYIAKAGVPAKRVALLYTIARGEHANHERAAQRAPMTVGLPSSSGERPPSGPGVESRAADMELRRAVIRALPPDLQPLFDLIYLQGLSESDAAATLGRPLGTISSMARRLRAELKALAERLDLTRR